MSLSDLPFRGLETLGLWLEGHLPRARALALAGADLGFAPVEGAPERCRAALLAVRIEGLRTWGLPFPRWTYPEAVWLLALASGRSLAIRAHTPTWMLPALSRVDRYHAASARIGLWIEEQSASLRVDSNQGALALSLDSPEEADRPLISELWTRDGRGRLYRIPWGADRPASTRTMACRVEQGELCAAVFGPEVEWDRRAVVFRDRVHRCGPAVRLPAATTAGGSTDHSGVSERCGPAVRLPSDVASW